MRWAGHVARIGDRRGVHRVLVGRPEGKRTLGRPRLGRNDNVRVDLKGLAWKEWTILVLLRTRAGDGLF
jgi:hypothetical protein